MRHLVLALLMLTACGAVVLAARDQPALAAESAEKDRDAKKDGGAKKEGPAKKDTSKPINKFCPIERENEIDPEVTTTYEGKVIGFCCEPCIKKFNADPKTHMKDLK